jgi:enamine deaminase RidA (YjgF/YER057c/UK114 family)
MSNGPATVKIFCKGSQGEFMRLNIVLLLLAAAAPQSLIADWKAGLAKADITPDHPIWLAGFGARTKPSEGVLQPIYVKALALQDETGAVSVLVTSDLLGFSREMAGFVAREAQSRFGLPRNRLAINSSHTHSAPVTDNVLRPAYPYDEAQQQLINKYTTKLLDQVVDTVGGAIKNLSPAALSFDQGLAGFAVNRRRSGRRNLPGPVDHDVPVLRVSAPDGKVRAIVFGYACHATSLSNYEVNGDWPGFAQTELESSHPGAMALFVTGAGADANPLPRRGVELSKAYGKILASAVDIVLDGKMRPVAGPLRTAFETVDLPFQQAPSRKELEQRLNDPRLGPHARFLLAVLERDGKLADRYPYPVQVWQFGKDLTWILLGGEVVVDYSLRLKKQYGWEDVWVSGYSNDVMAYIPSLRVLKEGGYEGGGAMIPYGQPASFRAPVEEIIIEKIDELITSVERVAGTGPLPGSAKAAVVKAVPLAHTGQILPLDRDGSIPENPQAQIDQVFANIERALQQAGTSLTKAVKVNFYVATAEVTPLLSRAFEKRVAGFDTPPAVSLVAGRLPHPNAVIAMDAIAIAGHAPAKTRDVAILPAGARSYISGQAAQGDLRKATVETLKTLNGNLEFLGLTRADVVQAKIFLQPMSSAPMVEEEIRTFFGGSAPPLVFVEWISKNPIEIELIAKGGAIAGTPAVEYLTPPGEKRARVFTRIVRVHHPATIYVSGMYGAPGSDGAAQIREIFGSLRGILEQTGSDLRHLVKATYYVSDEDTSRSLNELRPDYFEDGRAPAASKAMVPGTGAAGRTITLDMIAVPAT